MKFGMLHLFENPIGKSEHEVVLMQQMDDDILDGKYREATNAYCRLVAANPPGR